MIDRMSEMDREMEIQIQRETDRWINGERDRELFRVVAFNSAHMRKMICR